MGLEGLNLLPNAIKELLTVDIEAWKNEVKEIDEYYRIFSSKLPVSIHHQLEYLEKRLNEKG